MSDFNWKKIIQSNKLSNWKEIINKHSDNSVLEFSDNDFQLAIIIILQETQTHLQQMQSIKCQGRYKEMN